MAWGVIGGLVGLVALLGGIAAFTYEDPEPEYEPLLAIESSSISPLPDFFGVTALNEGDTATITIDVASLSDDYKGNGVLVASFEHEDAYQYFEIDEKPTKVGFIQQAGATSGPKTFEITVIKDPGSYEDRLLVKLMIEDELNAETSFNLKIN